MYYRCLLLVLLGSAGWYVAPLLAQAPHTYRPFVIDRWTSAEGLPQNSVNDIVQTADGYLWLATYDGAVRFDGVQFRSYTQGNTPGIPSNRITSLAEARDGGLWIGTEDGLALLQDGQAVRFGQSDGLPGTYINDVAIDVDGDVWVISDDAGRIYLSRGRDGRFEIRLTAEPDPMRWSYYHFQKGRHEALWAAWGGSVLGVERGGIETYAIARNGPDVAVVGVYEDEHGVTWAGTSDGILYRSDGERFVATSDLRKLGLKGSIQAFLYDTRDSLLWAGTTAALYGFARETGGSVRLVATVSRAAEHRLRALHQDAEGNIWEGSDGGGLVRIKEALFTTYGSAEGLETEIALSVTEDADGTVWAGTNCGGLFRMRAGRFTPVREREALPADGCIYAVLSGAEGALWVGRDALYRLDRQGAITRFAEAEGMAANPGRRNDFVLALYEDPADGGVLWVGTQDGLHRFDGSRFQRFTTADGLSHNHVRGILRTRDGTLWVTTRSGLSAMYGKHFLAYGVNDGLPTNDLRALHEDSDGVLWVGTYGRGLVRLERRNGGESPVIQSITTEDGLFDDVVSAILEDGAGYFWMSGNRGIQRVRRADMNAWARGEQDRVQATGYAEGDGLKVPETNGGFQPAAWAGSDGRLWFPTLGGIAGVDPQRVRELSLPPTVHIETIRYGGAVLPVSDDLEATGAYLEPDQRNFSVNYTGISLRAPEAVQFSYRLRGFDDAWTPAGTRREAYFTNVPPGEYQFEVRARSAEGTWSAETAAARVTVRPFFYETRLFATISFLLALSLLLVFYQRRLRRHARQTIELNRLVAIRTRELEHSIAEVEEERRRAEKARRTVAEQARLLRELDEQKNRFFANISHEFRTPLTLLLGPIEQMIARTSESAPAAREELNLMLRNGRRLQRLINQLLDLSRLQSGSVPINEQVLDLGALTRHHVALFGSIANYKRLTLTCDVSACLVRMDPDHLEKIVANLLSNAIKFTPSGGTIRILVAADGNEVVLSVADSGIGIPAAELPHIFDRFYQVDSSSTREHEGTGIGLSLAKELVQLYGGTITVESEPGVGTTFSVSLPVQHTGSGDGVNPDREGRPEPALSADAAGDGWRPEAVLAPAIWADTEPGSLEPDVDPHECAPPDDEKTVLVVEDNEDMRLYILSVLGPYYRVVEAGDGLEGLRAARELLPDIVVSDIMMPEMDGFALVRALRQEAATAGIPVILLTARADQADEIAGLDAGAVDYVVKPFESGVLLARVRSQVDVLHRLRERYQPQLHAPAESKFVAQVRAVIEEHMTDPNYSVENLADEVALSRSQLARRLNEEGAASPNQLIRTVRLEHAAALLRGGECNVSEAAYAVGFNSLNYFSRCFRQHFGSSPSECTGASALSA